MVISLSKSFDIKYLNDAAKEFCGKFQNYANFSFHNLISIFKTLQVHQHDN